MNYTSPLNVGWLVLAGAGTGVLGALLGTGGGVFLIPILVLGFGIPIHYAIATSIVSVIATSSAVAATNVGRGTANMRLGMTLECATTLGAILGGIVAGILSPRLLEGLFALVLVPTAFLMWKGRIETAATAPRQAGANVELHSAARFSSWSRKLDAVIIDDTGKPRPYQVHRLWAGLLVSLVAGTFSGLLGVGGGVFKVPALHLLCDVPMKAAAATSNFMIGVTAAASAFLYFGRGEVRPALTASIVLGVLAGSWIGLLINQRTKSRPLQKAFALLLLLVAVQMAVRSTFGRI
ncbi:MAG TPA: sulfite exporter TauE/SafE family protein [Planctomycetaceae bacterium]|nr:sulfite exporter TauE/SafE family protein [Planctomycetaceae bacterium]